MPEGLGLPGALGEEYPSSEALPEDTPVRVLGSTGLTLRPTPDETAACLCELSTPQGRAPRSFSKAMRGAELATAAPTVSVAPKSAVDLVDQQPLRVYGGRGPPAAIKQYIENRKNV